MCDVQRHAYAGLSEIDAARVELLSDSGMSVSSYDAFKERLGEDPQLRAHVAGAFDGVCGITGGES
jgi:hypothetical protein